MRVLGLSCGRPMGNSEVLVREALMGAEEVSGVEVEVIRLLDLVIKPCIGCEKCQGKIQECVQWVDHIPFLKGKLLESDGVILGAPTYGTMPPGLLRVISTRFTRFFRLPKLKARGLIAVGGGNSHWCNLSLPLMNLLFLRRGELVDQMVVPFTLNLGEVVLNEEAMARARRLGRNVGEAIKMPPGEVKYVGEAMKMSLREAKYVSETMKIPIDEVQHDLEALTEVACPLCHSNLFQVRGKSLLCAICDTQGRIEIVGDKARFVFDEEALQKSRTGPIEMEKSNRRRDQNSERYAEKKEEIKRKLEKYRAKPATKPPPL